mgnify:CR=1 FL=1|tara:strand:+ start:2978 stop:3166 length:189 start_codon:yes stop_codon:yes gene_type:complete
MRLRVELEDAPDWDQQLLYVSVGEMFDVDIEFKATDVVFAGSPRAVISCLAFYLLPMEAVEV